jgi:hypothetical protein
VDYTEASSGCQVGAIRSRFTIIKSAPIPARLAECFQPPTARMSDAAPLAVEGNEGHSPVRFRPFWNRIRNAAARWTGASYLARNLRGDGGTSARSARGRKEREGGKVSPQPVRDWMNDHPWTTIYIAIVVTLLLILQVIESVT